MLTSEGQKNATEVLQGKKLTERGSTSHHFSCFKELLKLSRRQVVVCVDSLKC